MPDTKKYDIAHILRESKNGKEAKHRGALKLLLNKCLHIGYITED